MSWYAYCLTEQASLARARARRPFAIEGMKGIDGAQVFAFPSGDFAVVISELGRRVNEKDAFGHAHVVGECFRQGTVLPLRFGTVFETEEGLRQVIRSNRRVLLDTIDALRDKCEMHIKVVMKDAHALNDSALPTAVGSEYLSKLRERAAAERECQTRARAVTSQVTKLFNPLQQEIVCKKVPSGMLTIDIAHLVETSELPKYQMRTAAAQRQLRDCRVAITGPWPPYHFLPEKIRTVSETSNN